MGEDDLRGLVSSPAELARGVGAALAGLEASHAHGRGQVIFGDLAREGADYTKLMGTAAPGQGMGVQVFPSQGNAVDAVNSKLMLWFDRSGSLLAIFSSEALNGLRTAIPAALGARHLAPRGARCLGILGSGYQASFHARTIAAALPGLDEIRVWSPTPSHRERFAAAQSAVLGIPVEPCGDAEAVLGKADVLSAAGRTPGGTAAYDAGWVKPGALLISMTRSAPPELLERARFVVPTQRRPERVAVGFTGTAAPRPAPDPESAVQLVDVVHGAAPREHPDQPVIWELGNLYLWDLAIMRWAYEWVVKERIGAPFRLGSSL